MNIVGAEGYCSSISSRLVELMTTPCFHFFYTGKITVGGENLNLKRDREPEYSFESDFVSGLDEYNDEGRPVRSRLTITMYFNGEQREFVHRWQTTGTWDIQTNSGTTWNGHGDKLKNGYKAGPKIAEIMREFEKRPVDCTITPEIIEVATGQTIEIRITDLQDQESRKSREFNRIVVHALNGTITDGEECDNRPRLQSVLGGKRHCNITLQSTRRLRKRSRIK